MLTSGGDARIHCDANGINKYGCAPTPQTDALSYSSSTASSISTHGYAAAEALYQRIAAATDERQCYADENQRIHSELADLCALDTRTHIILGASGTDIHRRVTEMLQPSCIIMSEAAETGSGIPTALADGGCTEIVSIAGRAADGHMRSIAEVDEEVMALAEHAVETNQRLLLVMTDCSKTGLLIPSVSCALALKQRHPDSIDILVDACQFRLANTTIHAYLAQGFLLAITGSKFLAGPAFSSALFVPAQRKLNPVATDEMNWGLLLRMQAALTELRALRNIPEDAIANFLNRAAHSIEQRLHSDAVLLPLPIRRIDRAPLTSGAWDMNTTIFPFLLRHRSGAWFTREDTTQLYQYLREDMCGHEAIPSAMHGIAARRCFVGQPVLCGVRDHTPLSALRLNLDARVIVDALSPEGRGADTVIAEALTVLDKAAMLAKHLF